MNTRRPLLVAWKCGVLGLIVAFTASAAAVAHRTKTVTSPAATAEAQQPKKTVWDGIYTEAQAKRGEQLFRRVCAYCHGADLRGRDDPGAPPLIGSHFSLRWREVTVAEMFATIGETMPQNEPASLKPEALIDIISFIFQANDIPAGSAELPPDPEKLEQILITDKPPKG